MHRVVLWPHAQLSIVQEFAQEEAAMQRVFAHAWTKMMNRDRFDGPVGNVCDNAPANHPVR